MAAYDKCLKYVLAECKARKIPAQTLVNSLIFAFTFPLNVNKAFIARAKDRPPNGIFLLFVYVFLSWDALCGGVSFLTKIKQDRYMFSHVTIYAISIFVSKHLQSIILLILLHSTQ